MPPARPNQAAASPAPRQRILRIGVLLGGKIVEERLIRERSSVSLGQGMKNTFSIPVEGLPMEFTLFAVDENKYYLRFLPKMDGRLSDSGGQVNTLDALKQRGATNHGDYWQVPLADSARGKLSLGDLTVLFQFVTEPPRQPKPMLPASVRGTFADRFDPRLSVILGASIICHFAIVIIALAMDVEKDEGIAERAFNMEFKQDVVVDLTQPKVDTKPDAGSDGSAAKTPEKAPEKSATKAPAKDTGHDANKVVQLKEDDVTALVDGLTGEGPNGRSEADMSKRRPNGDIIGAINEIKDANKSVSVGGNAGRGSRDDGSSRPGTGHGPNLNGPSGTESAGGGKVAEHAPSGRITVSDRSTSDDSTLTPDIVLAKIMNAYMAGLKRCYKNYLVKDASARGKVTLSLTVNQTGRTTKGAANGFAGEVDACIGGQMSSWRFPIPKDKDGEATDANFQITLQLVPD